MCDKFVSENCADCRNEMWDANCIFVVAELDIYVCAECAPKYRQQRYHIAPIGEY